jgi:hypothetical protein
MSAYKHGRPIAVSGDEARAIERGEATAILRHARNVTRVVDGVALSPLRWLNHGVPSDVIECPFARVGDTLYGCEKWFENEDELRYDAIIYRADANKLDVDSLRWHRASSMQWWMSRFARVVTKVEIVDWLTMTYDQVRDRAPGRLLRISKMNPAPYCWLITLGKLEGGTQ